MLYDEVYSTSFRTIGKIVNEAIINNGITFKRIQSLAVDETSNIAAADKVVDDLTSNGDFSFLYPEEGSTGRKYRTNIKNHFERPMTDLEKQWLRTILENPRVRLFIDEQDVPEQMKDIQPLFSWNDVVFYDQFSDGDDFGNPKYIENFRLILKAIKERSFILVKHGNVTFKCFPRKLEYSQRDDKFRLLNSGVREDHKVGYLRLSKIDFVEILEFNDEFDTDEYNKDLAKHTVTVAVSEENNTKERFLLHFSPFQRETIKIGDGLWKVKLAYDEDMDREMVNGILSFGHYVKVEEPESFRQAIREKLNRQSLEI